MPNVVVDLSARSKHIREEPWHLHFWENTVPEALEYLKDPRGFLERIGIKLPDDSLQEGAAALRGGGAGRRGGRFLPAVISR
jgi:hypothetical protein